MTQQEFHQRYTYNAVTDKLDEDGFGSVFRAYDNYLDQWVALTILTVNPPCESIQHIQPSLATKMVTFFNKWMANAISVF